RVQVIRRNNSKSEELVNAVNCCFDSGKIAVAYGQSIRIFEPVHYENETGSHNLHYRWYETQLIEVAETVSTVQWVLEGLRLLVSSGKDIFLYQHRMLTSAVANKPSASGGGKLSSEASWELVWTTRLATKARFVKFSPDGTLFASCGENDRMIKVWYPKSEPNTKDQLQFSFVYLQHPAIVSGFEWRRTGRYMPRKCVQNALITWCEDNTSRIWKETPNTDRYTELLLDAVDSVTEEKQRRKKSKHSRIKKARSRLVKKLSIMVKDKRHPRLSVDGGGGKLTRSSTFADFSMPAAANTLNFCLAATIDAENDCLLVPSMSSFNPAAKKTFAVHWLNNKELMFTSGAEKILAEALLNEHIDVVHRGGKGFSPTGFISNANSIDGSTSAQADSTMPRTPSSYQQLSATDTQHSASVPRSMSGSDIFSAKDILDVKLEGLLRQWNKSYDVLFSVHPVDGSLLTWTVEWLDDNWRQPTVSFSSRFPNAFPITDASSLNLSLSTFNPHDPVYVEVLQRHPPDLNENTNENAETMTRKRDKLLGEVSKANTVLLLTSHENGSLNLWHLAMDDRSQYTTILNIVHRSRMCGHRFHIQQIVPHPVLPLLLTASRFVPTHGKTHSVKEAELILWKVAPVGPLCKSGGVRELARVTSCTPKAFTTIAWIPAILP
ncbi:RBC-1 protein, partial [Aphelenchoides avenae]